MRRWETIVKRLPNDRPIVGAELGVLKGATSVMLLEHLPMLMLYLVDRWTAYSPEERELNNASPMALKDAKKFRRAYKTTRKRVAPYGDRAKILRMSTSEAARVIPNDSLDFVFHDADHTCVGLTRDIEEWLPKVKLGGWICGHDYNNAGERFNHSGVAEAVDAMFKQVELDDDYTWFVKVGCEK